VAQQQEQLGTKHTAASHSRPQNGKQRQQQKHSSAKATNGQARPATAQTARTASQQKHTNSKKHKQSFQTVHMQEAAARP